MIVDVTFALELFMLVKEGITPLPDAANPILLLLFVHVYVTPVNGLLVKEMEGCTVPGHKIKSSGGSVIVTLGLSVIVIV